MQEDHVEFMCIENPKLITFINKLREVVSFIFIPCLQSGALSPYLGPK